MSTLTTSDMSLVCGGLSNPNVCAKYDGAQELACYLGGAIAALGGWFASK